MPTLRSYSKSEDAFMDAAFLCGMGLDATVFDERAYGGNLQGAIASAIRIEVPDEQLSDAAQLLANRASDVPKAAMTAAPPVADSDLHRLLRFFLIADLGCYALFLGLGRFFYTPAPPAVDEFLASLAFSNALWRLAFAGCWPLIILAVIAHLLCLFYSRLGRTLFAVTTVWSILAQLGPPPVILDPFCGFFGNLQVTLTSIALALMYWSSLNERFRD